MRLDAVAKGERAFKRVEWVAILLTPAWVAGIYRAGVVVFNLVNAVSALAWSVAIGVGAYYVGPPVLEVLGDLGTVGTVLAIGLVAGGIATALLRRWRGAGRRQAGREPAQ